MSTLNARASEAWRLVEAESEFGFESDQDAFEEGWETGYKAAAAESAPRPVIDREAVKKLVQDELAAHLAGTPALVHLQMLVGPRVADAVMELARPMPTREQVAQAIIDGTETDAWVKLGTKLDDFPANLRHRLLNQADAVLALFNRSES